MTTPTDRDVEVRKVDRARLYEAFIDGEVVGTLGYETTAGKTALTHSFVDPDKRNRGIGSALAEYALEDVTTAGGRPLIYCGFVADYVGNHPKWAGAVDISHWMIPTRSERSDVPTSGSQAVHPARTMSSADTIPDNRTRRPEG